MLVVLILQFTYAFLLWLTVPLKYWLNKSLIFLWLLFILGILRYCLLLISFMSISKYSIIGGLRRVSQIISFEVRIRFLLFISFILLSKSTLTLNKFNTGILRLGVLLITLLLILLETHRAPIDLSEGERELVSGYNTEFRRILFIILFLTEYRNILVLTNVAVFLFIKFNFILWSLIFILILLIRACFPRIRYDSLINLFWYKGLGIIIFTFIIVLAFKNY